MIEGQFLAFLVAITLLTIAPGADTVMMTRNSIRGGFKDGFVTSVGICSGLFIHAAISAAGVSLILLGSAYLFSVIKLLGAGYLIWMGLQSLLSALKGEGEAAKLNVIDKRFSFKRSLREGFLSNVLNPKTAVFYMAFLPQFIDPAGNAFLQAQGLALVHIFIAMIWQCLIAAMVDRAKVFLSSPKVSRWFDGLIGTLLIGFGLTLAFDRD